MKRCSNWAHGFDRHLVRLHHVSVSNALSFFYLPHWCSWYLGSRLMWLWAVVRERNDMIFSTGCVCVCVCRQFKLGANEFTIDGWQCMVSLTGRGIDVDKHCGIIHKSELRNIYCWPSGVHPTGIVSWIILHRYHFCITSKALSNLINETVKLGHCDLRTRNDSKNSSNMLAF